MDKSLVITLTDPEGFPVNLIWGQSQVSSGLETPKEKLIFNTGEDKQRKAKILRFKEGPAAVHKVRWSRAYLQPTK